MRSGERILWTCGYLLDNEELKTLVLEMWRVPVELLSGIQRTESVDISFPFHSLKT